MTSFTQASNLLALSWTFPGGANKAKCTKIITDRLIRHLSFLFVNFIEVKLPKIFTCRWNVARLCSVSLVVRCGSRSNWSYKLLPVNCSDCHDSDIGDTGRNLTTRLTEHKRVKREGDVNNHIAEHHRLTNHTIDWDSAQCLTYSTNYFQRLTLESWFTNLEQTPLNRCQPLLAPYKRLIHDINITNEPNRTT